jgi:membrane protein YqaA with SNARE-associated domain
MSAYLSLFLSGFLSATLLPGSSEALLAYLASQGSNPVALLVAATLGNTLGALVNYLLGRFCLAFRDRRWFPLSAAALARGEAWFTRYGVWSLLLSWLPLVGDPLTFVAGILKTRLAVFLILVALGKALRYLAVLLGTLALSG